MYANTRATKVITIDSAPTESVRSCVYGNRNLYTHMNNFPNRILGLVAVGLLILIVICELLFSIFCFVLFLLSITF